MNNYNCKYGFFHDKPCKNEEPSSNNGWTYTAISKYALGMKYHTMDFFPVFRKCFNIYGDIHMLNRLPGKELPPISRDEVIGLASLGQPVADLFSNNGWKMYVDILEKIPLRDTIKTLWAIRKEHRNFFWKNEILEVYPITMRLFWHDRYYLKKVSRMNTTYMEFYLFYLYAWSIIFRGSPGEQNLLYVQLKDLGSQLAVFIPFRKNLLKYFGEEHIFNRQNMY